MKETKFKQTLVQTKEGSRHCEERSDVAIQGRFKMTEVGMIPNDWEVFLLSDLCSKIFSGKNKEKHEIGNYLVYGSTGVLGYSNKFAYDKPAILIARVGANAGLINEVDGKYDVSDNTLIVYGISCCQHYIYEFLKFWNLNKLVFGSGQPLITGGQLKKIEIPLPPTIKEQQRIANALSDVDTLIANLEKLIAKKKNIKQGAMQQLLTGKKRLPGFAPAKPTYKQTELGMIPTDWESINLGSIADIRTGKRNGDESETFGKYPFFVRSQTVYRINSYSFDGEAILIPGEGGIGSIFHYINGKFDYHQRVYKISDFSVNFSAKYLFYFMKRYFGSYAKTLTVKATVDSLRLPTFENFVVWYPLSKAEQTAIANVLSDMDTEISALETKLAKYRKLKTGMMQQLLTGKIRLIK